VKADPVNGLDPSGRLDFSLPGLFIQIGISLTVGAIVGGAAYHFDASGAASIYIGITAALVTFGFLRFTGFASEGVTVIGRRVIFKALTKAEREAEKAAAKLAFRKALIKTAKTGERLTRKPSEVLLEEEANQELKRFSLVPPLLDQFKLGQTEEERESRVQAEADKQLAADPEHDSGYLLNLALSAGDIATDSPPQITQLAAEIGVDLLDLLLP
jgi:hypothetical protein